MTRMTTILATLAAFSVACPRSTPPDDPMPDRSASEEPAVEPIGQQPDEQDPLAQDDMQRAEVLPVSAILASPMAWSGRTVQGVADVGSVVTKRGFWLQDGGNRVFTVVSYALLEEPIQIAEGQTLQLDEATVYTSADIDMLVGEGLDPEAELIAREQGVFLLVDQGDITIMSGQGS